LALAVFVVRRPVGNEPPVIGKPLMQELGQTGLLDDAERARPEHFPMIEPLNQNRSIGPATDRKEQKFNILRSVRIGRQDSSLGCRQVRRKPLMINPSSFSRNCSAISTITAKDPSQGLRDASPRANPPELRAFLLRRRSLNDLCYRAFNKIRAFTSRCPYIAASMS
jgi:hypothetical protein